MQNANNKNANDAFIVLNPPITIKWQMRDNVAGTDWIGNVPPPGPLNENVPAVAFQAYRAGKAAGCADVALFTVRPDIHSWTVLLSKRSTDKPFGGKWWIHGGAVPAYANLVQFLGDRAEKECGCRPDIRALIAVAYTSAADHIASTIQPCYLGLIEYESVSKAIVDGDHTAVRLFTLDEYRNLPQSERHWYIDGVVINALLALD